MNKKYEMFKEYEADKFYRIRALKDFGNVKAGDIGGYIEKEENLSHEGDCWVYDSAKVYGHAKVCDSAKIYGCAEICGNAMVYGKAQVYGLSVVSGHSIICNKTTVCGCSVLKGGCIGMQ
ncbi:MAG: hypothetical protein K2G70_01080 [Turicibacter sp.]|nr:hypothetical protein [Turicibacter sp.]